MTLRVALPRRFLAVPARASMTMRLPARSCLRSLADLILTLTFVPPLTVLKVENSALLAVVRTRRRTRVAPCGTVRVTGTPVVPNAAAFTVAGAATRATATATRAPSPGTAAATAAGEAARAGPAAAAPAAAGGSGAVGSAAVRLRPSIGRQFHSSAGVARSLFLPTTAGSPCVEMKLTQSAFGGVGMPPRPVSYAQVPSTGSTTAVASGLVFAGSAGTWLANQIRTLFEVRTVAV